MSSGSAVGDLDFDEVSSAGADLVGVASFGVFPSFVDSTWWFILSIFWNSGEKRSPSSISSDGARLSLNSSSAIGTCSLDEWVGLFGWRSWIT